jgi:succinoglycan biosynthesis protein ExoM
MSPPLISVCICTYKRPELLADLLGSLARQRVDHFTFEVVVVDNDKFGSARGVVEQHANLWLEAMTYAIEPRQGISFARNHAVSLARGRYVAFIDDDEIASDEWLLGLFTVQQAFKCHVVLGPVLPIYPPGTPAWIIDSRYFDRPRHRTGEEVPAGEGRCSNALVESVALRQGPLFDESLAFSGGEDFELFQRIAAATGPFRWCDEAAVSELVPASRQRMTWMLERRLRTSVTYWRIVRPQAFQASDLFSIFSGVIGGMLFALVGAVCFPLARHRALQLWSKAAGGFGRLLARLPVQLEGYRDKKASHV